MKIIKEDINNIPEMEKEAKAVVDATTGEAKQEADENEEKNKEFFDAKEIIKKEPLTGAEKQPVPEKVELPKIELDESLFEDFEEVVDVVEVPAAEAEVVIDMDAVSTETPEVGVELGIANTIHDLIIDENEAIQGYNNALANMESCPCVTKIMQDIIAEEMNHIGMLEKALELVSPNVANIEEGQVEAEETLAEGEAPITESLNEGAVREVTNNLIDAVDGGLVSAEDVMLACLKYMSEDQVEEMCKMNDFNVCRADEVDEEYCEKCGREVDEPCEDCKKEAELDEGRKKGSLNEPDDEPEDIWTKVMKEFEAADYMKRTGMDFDDNILVFGDAEDSKTIKKAIQVAKKYNLDYEVKDLTKNRMVADESKWVVKIIIPEGGIYNK